MELMEDIVEVNAKGDDYEATINDEVPDVRGQHNKGIRFYFGAEIFI